MSIRKPKGRTIVVCNRQTEALRDKAQTSHRRRRLIASQFAFFREYICDLARRPRHSVARAERNLIDPPLLVVGRKLAMFAVSIDFDEPAIVTACDDARSVGHAGQNGTGVDFSATVAFVREQKRFFAEHEYRCRAKKMHADNSRVRGYMTDAVGK